ncbi:MAG TPA: MFS transporter [Methanocorpusculum sp.]|nr:MFS transporter [Methanocorpusculum sp.]
MITIPSNTTTLTKTIVITVVAVLLYGVVSGIRGLTAVFIPELAAVTGLSYGTVSSIFAVRNIVYAISVFAVGLLTQKIPIRYLMAAGAALVAAGLAGTAFSTQFVTLLIFLGIVTGLGAGALCYAIVYAAVAPLLGRSEGAVCAGIISASQGIFCIFLTPFVQSMGSTAPGLALCFLILGAAAACLVPLSILFFRKRRNPEAEPNPAGRKTSRVISAPLRYMGKRPYFHLLVLAAFAYGLCDAGMINHLSEKAQTMLSATPEFATYLVMIYALALIIGPVLGGFVTAKAKNARVLFIILIAAWLAIATSVYYLPMTQTTGILVVAGMGLAASMLVPTLSIMTQERSPISLFPAIFPVIMLFECFAYAFDAYFGGLCYDVFGTFDLSMLITFIICAAVIVLFLISVIKDRKTKPE